MTDICPTCGQPTIREAPAMELKLSKLRSTAPGFDAYLVTVETIHAIAQKVGSHVDERGGNGTFDVKIANGMTAEVGIGDYLIQLPVGWWHLVLEDVGVLWEDVPL